MKHLRTNCPACGGLVEFRTGSSLVTVCEFCHSAVGRDDREVKDYGKVAEVGDPASGLARGITGTWKGNAFTITGRVRYRHSGGGSWDEWYLSFAGERWAWLSEAQGKFALTNKRPLTGDAKLPAFDSIDLDSKQSIKDTELTVREKGVAVAEGAEGELPFALHPGEEHQYIDLYGVDQAVATFDYGSGLPDAEQAAYLGREVTLEELGIEISSLDPNAGVEHVGSLQLNCPHCGGPLALRAPDETLRVACPNCSSMLNADKGKLSLFQTLHQEKVKPLIPLGSEGSFGGVKYTVIGFMERYAKYAGRIYPWTEYLLYNRKSGFRWLVCNEYHWSLVGPVDRPPSGSGSTAHYKGSDYRIYDRGTATVRYVLGEFYWRVTVGDKVKTADFISPPRMLSFERSGWGKTEEVSVSEGHYITTEELESTFGVTNLPRPWGVGVIQPAPSAGKWFWVTWPGLLAYLLFVVVVLGRGSADMGLFMLAVLGVSIPPVLMLIYKHSFEVRRWNESDYSPYQSED